MLTKKANFRIFRLNTMIGLLIIALMWATEQNSTELKLTPEHSLSVYVQSPAAPIHMRGETLVEPVSFNFSINTATCQIQ